MRVRTCVGLLVVALFIALPPAPASASCIETPSIEENLNTADVVFVGTTVELNNRNRWGTFTVNEVWKGDPGLRVDVRAGPPGEAATSVDRSFDIDKRYLVFATKGDPHLEDNACSATRPYEDSLAGFRPAGARIIETVDRSADDDGGIESGTVVFAVVMVVVVVGGLFVVRRWGRNTH